MCLGLCFKKVEVTPAHSVPSQSYNVFSRQEATQQRQQVPKAVKTFLNTGKNCSDGLAAPWVISSITVPLSGSLRADFMDRIDKIPESPLGSFGLGMTMREEIRQGEEKTDNERRNHE